MTIYLEARRNPAASLQAESEGRGPQLVAMALEEYIAQKMTPHTKADGTWFGLIWPEAGREADSSARPCLPRKAFAVGRANFR